MQLLYEIAYNSYIHTVTAVERMIVRIQLL
jgi:hypothetical protein